MSLNPDARALLASLDDLTRRERQAQAAQDPLQALLMAVDAGDDTVLPQVADLLEEQGDARAAGMRELLRIKWRPVRKLAASVAVWVWEKVSQRQDALPFHLPKQVFNALLPKGAPREGAVAMAYPTRSLAFLALAAALAG